LQNNRLPLQIKKQKVDNHSTPLVNEIILPVVSEGSQRIPNNSIWLIENKGTGPHGQTFVAEMIPQGVRK